LSIALSWLWIGWLDNAPESRPATGRPWPGYAEGRLDRLPALAQDLVRLNVDVIAAFGPLTIKPAWEATRTTPIG
jgi:hypothetical protein